jgi:hypothetical protein
LWEQRIRSIHHPCINPAYRITGQPGKWKLSRAVKDQYAKTVSRLDKVCIPDSGVVIARSPDTAGLIELQRTDPAQFAQLARSLLVLDLPEKFMPQSHMSPSRTNFLG